MYIYACMRMCEICRVDSGWLGCSGARVGAQVHTILHTSHTMWHTNTPCDIQTHHITSIMYLMWWYTHHITYITHHVIYIHAMLFTACSIHSGAQVHTYYYVCYSSCYIQIHHVTNIMNAYGGTHHVTYITHHVTRILKGGAVWCSVVQCAQVHTTSHTFWKAISYVCVHIYMYTYVCICI